MKFIVTTNRLEKFNSTLDEIAQKFDVEEEYKLESVTLDTTGLDENVIIMRIDVPTGDKKEAEKYLHFNHEIFLKLSLDYYPSYSEAPIIRK